MAKTNSGLVAYAKAQVGKPYWFGTFGQTGSAALYTAKKKQYPNYYTAKDFPKQYGKRVHDCAGLIKGYLWSSSATATPVYKASQDFGATGFYTHAKKKGTIGSFPQVKGMLVFKGKNQTMTHVGIYDGAGYVIEAKGHAYGVIKTKLVGGGWTHWAQCHLVTDDTSKADSKPTATPKPASGKTYKVRVNTVLNVRAGAGMKYPVINQLKNGTKVTVYETKNGWGRIGSGQWCSMSYLK